MGQLDVNVSNDCEDNDYSSGTLEVSLGRHLTSFGMYKEETVVSYDL